ncbi:rhodanese-like domain-containing protein [Algoriphagus sp. D3-2-R+10]|uniref:rhodanese-like domain-containing protein n=1 Tax=Algoriphagus aurantiacus TaxID=3103948 RepID=UPI002B38679C|nr:rhodanese-like domain-containing protein [Algoriphagus sp. D3-2-R+10]MEB2774496.1 rhodanese-like domain-containing protein [Algoriphagus sp. D3-2-R+10]
MKLQKILILTFAIILVSTVFTQAQSSKVIALSVAEFEELAKNKGAVRILDVRTPEEMAEGHLLGVTNVDYKNNNFKSEIAKLDKKRTYLLYCKTGVRSGDAASVMKAAGFTHIYSLDGGIEAWQEAGKPIEK